jgi:hypothetical protein
MNAHQDSQDAHIYPIIDKLKAFLLQVKDPTPSDDIGRLSQAVIQDLFTRSDICRVQDKFPSCVPKLQKRIKILHRLRSLRLQDTHRSFEKKVALAWNASKRNYTNQTQARRPLPNKRRHTCSTSVRTYLERLLRLVNDTNHTLQSLLEIYGNGNDHNDASSISSDTSSGFELFYTRDDETLAGKGAMYPRFLTKDDAIQVLPEMPTYLRDLVEHETLCPFCWCVFNSGLTVDQWNYDNSHLLKGRC